MDGATLVAADPDDHAAAAAADHDRGGDPGDDPRRSRRSTTSTRSPAAARSAATTLIVQFIYETSFQSPVRYGLASAAGVVLFLVVFGVTVDRTTSPAAGRRRSRWRSNRPLPHHPGPRPRGWTSTAADTQPTSAAGGARTLLTAGALVMLAPIVWAVLSSFKSPAELAVRPPSVLPDSLDGRQLHRGARPRSTSAQYFFNSVFVTVVRHTADVGSQLDGGLRAGQVQLPRPRHALPRHAGHDHDPAAGDLPAGVPGGRRSGW